MELVKYLQNIIKLRTSEKKNCLFWNKVIKAQKLLDKMHCQDFETLERLVVRITDYSVNSTKSVRILESVKGPFKNYVTLLLGGGGKVTKRLHKTRLITMRSKPDYVEFVLL